MVFGQRTKTTAEQLVKKDQDAYEARWGWNYIKKHFKDGDKVYSPLYDLEFTVEFLEEGDHWLFAHTDDDCITFQPFEVIKR